MEQSSEYLQLNERDLLSRLVLNASDAARVCGVTTRQLTYWTDKGIIPCHGDEHRSYGAEALERAILIRKAMEGGATLEKAAEVVKQQLAAREASPVADRPREVDAGIAELDQRLLRLDKGLSVFRVRLPTYLALCKLMDLVAEVQQTTVESILDDSPFDPEASEMVASRLEHAISEIRLALDEVRRGPVIA